MKIKILLVSILLALTFSPAAHAFKAEGFSQPSGVAVDPKTNYTYVSNVAGDPKAEDGNGFISKLKGDGTVERMRFIDGATKGVTLNAPKGMAVTGDRIYVADINRLHAFELATGRALFDVNFGNLPVQHFYDVALGPDGALYVADGPGNTIYRVDIERQHEVTVFITGEELGQPHGITWFPGRQVFAVSGWSSGKVTAYDRAGKQQTYPAILLRTLEGIAADSSGNMFVSSSGLGAVYRIGANFAVNTFKLSIKSPAGIAYSASGNEVIVACTDIGMVESISISAEEEGRSQSAVTESLQTAPPPSENAEQQEESGPADEGKAQPTSPPSSETKAGSAKPEEATKSTPAEGKGEGGDQDDTAKTGAGESSGQ